MNFRSPKLLKAARDQPCVLCGSTGTTIAAHANWQEFGKGMGLKAHDWATAHLCHICHDIIDGRTIGRRWDTTPDRERREIWMRAWIKTIERLFEQGIVVVK